MATSISDGFPAFETAREILINRRVKIAAGKVTYADDDVKGIGTSLGSASQGGLVAIQLHSQGIAVMTSNTAVTVSSGSIAYAANSGLVSATGTVAVGIYSDATTVNLGEVGVYAG